MQPEALRAALAELLHLPATRLPDVVPFAASGNNRVFAVTAGEHRYAAKVYFRHPSDERDRLNAEYSFLSCANRAGITCVPKPVACDPARGIGVYEFIEGSKLTAAEVNADCIDQAAKFIARLNQAATRKEGRNLPEASEACFSIVAHFSMVDRRIERLDRISSDEPVDREAREFSAALKARWGQLKSLMLKEAAAARIDPDTELTERCLSPSDFGFHNALATRERGICFIDFEYAGWDDPAKLVGDFFSHPAIPVDIAHLERFVKAVSAYAAQPAEIAARARILFPVFQVKWCCIILNEFLPEAAKRRLFADPGTDPAARKRGQLNKAASLFERIHS
jgi:thiamine kinase-like enzyme